MCKDFAKAFTAVGLAALGMAGLYFKVEYSGWVLAAALYVVVN